MGVTIRMAQAEDAAQILNMVNRFAEQNIMLPRTEESVRQTLSDWLVAVEEHPAPGEPVVVGCGALVPLTDTLVEIRSLAVHESQQGKGLGGKLVLALVEMARQREFHQVCALTLREDFFTRLGFEQVDRWSISPKVWQACIYCRKFHRCDEVAVSMTLAERRQPVAPEPINSGAWASLLKWEEWQPLRLAHKRG